MALRGRMEDPLTGYVPSRVHILEDEEKEAEASASSYADPPVVTWSAAVCNAIKAGGGQLKLRLLLMATSLEGSALLRHWPGLGEEQGSVVLATNPPNRSEKKAGQSFEQVCRLYSPDATALAAGSGVLFGLCQGNIPAERAFAWAKGLLHQLQPDQVIVLTTLPAAEFAGGTRSDSMQHFALSTSSGAANLVLPKMPTGSLVPGPAAALMSRLQALGIPAVLLVGVQASYSPGRQAVEAVAAALQPCLPLAGVSAASASKLKESSTLSAAAQDLRSAWRKSPRSHLYL